MRRGRRALFLSREAGDRLAKVVTLGERTRRPARLTDNVNEPTREDSRFAERGRRKPILEDRFRLTSCQ
jgi:hypothetical protein